MDDTLSNKTMQDIPLRVTYIHFEHGWGLEVGRKFPSTAMPDSCFGCNYKSRE